jgi:hypothetical protein
VCAKNSSREIRLLKERLKAPAGLLIHKSSWIIKTPRVREAEHFPDEQAGGPAASNIRQCLNTAAY